MERKEVSGIASGVLVGMAFAVLVGVIVVSAIALDEPMEKPEERVILDTTRLLTRPAEEVFEQAVSLGQGENVRIRFRAEGGRIDFLIYTSPSPPETTEYQELIVKRGVVDPEDFGWLIPRDGTYRFRFCLGGDQTVPILRQELLSSGLRSSEAARLSSAKDADRQVSLMLRSNGLGWNGRSID